jgi:hypothetical protein
MTKDEIKRFKKIRYETIRAKCFIHYENYFYDLNPIKFENEKK